MICSSQCSQGGMFIFFFFFCGCAKKSTIRITHTYMRECSNLAVCSAGMCIFRRDLAFRGKKNQDKKSRLKRFYSFIIVVSYHLNCNKDEKVLSIIYCQKANEKTTSATPATKAKGKEAETAATAILIVVVGFYHCDDCSKRLVPSRDTKRA